jgi:enamine deaminase RidA (YjgF/YER057c/UK114 family)
MTWRRREVLAGLGGMAAAAAANGEPQQPAARRHINLPDRPVQAPFSDAVLAGNTLYLAGRIGLDPKTGMPPPDLEQEIRLLLDGMKATLAAAGMTMDDLVSVQVFDDLVSVQVFCPDLSLYDRFNAVYRTYFKDQPPARAFIGSGPLLRGGRFETSAIAIKR